ncbi:MAG: hypothetical protein HY903_24795 [Deltaproteobacteria bacterium]|nr:hypothetical protein [Deltaproteobacteria bacterium]
MHPLTVIGSMVLVPAFVGAVEDAPRTEVKAAAAMPRQAAVLELAASGIEADVVRNLTDLLTAEASKIPGYKVISHAEIKDMIGFELQKQSVGCEEASCLAQIGGALGVDLIVTGSFGRLGDTFVVNVRLINITRGETESRVSETIAGRMDLLPDFIRTVAWRLFEGRVPADVQAAYDATKARLDKDAAAAEKAKADAEKARADAEKARADTEASKAQRAGGSASAPGISATGKEGPAPVSGSWQRVARSAATGVAVVGLLSGGALHALSYSKARDVGSPVSTDDPTISVYDAAQTDAQKAWDLRTYAIYAYTVGGLGVVAAIVFKILEPSAAAGTAWRVTPTPHGLAAEF